MNTLLSVSDWILPVAIAAIAAALLGILSWRAERHRRSREADPRNLIGRALRHRGLTPADAESCNWEPELFEARDRCGQCVSQPTCRSRLDSGQGPLDAPACPNAARFRDWASQRRAPAQSRPQPARPPGSPGVL